VSRNQSHRLPLVFRSEKTVTPVEQTKTMPEIENVYKCQDEFLPDIEWERETIHNFALLRQVRLLFKYNLPNCDVFY